MGHFTAFILLAGAAVGALFLIEPLAGRIGDVGDGLSVLAGGLGVLAGEQVAKWVEG